MPSSLHPAEASAVPSDIDEITYFVPFGKQRLTAVIKIGKPSRTILFLDLFTNVRHNLCVSIICTSFAGRELHLTASI